MNETSTPASRKRGPARSLDERHVVGAALEVLDRGGPGALGIRAVAARLEIQPNAVYTYVEDRAALERAVAERVLSLADVATLSSPGRSWRQRLTDYADALRATLLLHPGAASLLMTAPMNGPTAVVVGELMMAALEEAGLSAEDAARATYLLIVQVIGSVALDVAETDGHVPLPDERDRIAERRNALAGIDPAALPRTAAAADVMASWIGQDQFRWALDTVLDGIATRAPGSDHAD
jgi:AcrR family transcriptional regulator